jgi:hypothetical protein
MFHAGSVRRIRGGDPLPSQACHYFASLVAMRSETWVARSAGSKKSRPRVGAGRSPVRDCQTRRLFPALSPVTGRAPQRTKLERGSENPGNRATRTLVGSILISIKNGIASQCAVARTIATARFGERSFALTRNAANVCSLCRSRSRDRAVIRFAKNERSLSANFFQYRKTFTKEFFSITKKLYWGIKSRIAKSSMQRITAICRADLLRAGLGETRCRPQRSF